MGKKKSVGMNKEGNVKKEKESKQNKYEDKKTELPDDFKERMKKMLEDEYESFLTALQESDYKGIRRNPLKIGEDDFRQMMPFPMEEIPWCETGYYYEEEYRPGKHPFHDAGLFYIQEPSAMAVAEYADVMPGDRVLDLCAAPGGKSTQLAGKLLGEGLLICNEIHPTRALILSENIERMGIKNAIVTNETPGRLVQHFPGFFDKIIVDAPCSGEGMFRKNEEALSQWSLENVEMCAARQDDILADAIQMLRPGGRLVYSTCTFAPAENEGTVERLLEKYEEMKLVKAETKGNMSHGNPDFGKSKRSDLSSTIRLWPHRIKGEGHFLAIFEKEGKEKDFQRIPPVGGFEKGRMISEFKEADTFIKENLKVVIEDRIVTFGEHLYLLPNETPVLKGLKVIRPGLHLGTMKKNRFEPAHALSLSLKKEEAVFSYDMKADGNEVKQYLLGATIPYEGEKGWYLMMVEGYSLGWAKLAGNILKNHYPKGLRH